MRLLLHICCGPCLIAPLEELRRKNFSVTGFFYNPNIHPYSEYRNRKKAVADLATGKKLEVIFAEYDLENYFRSVVGHEKSIERCPICWRARLLKTAQKAKELGADHFTTTLLVSPYQDQNIIKSISEEIAEKEGIKFYYQDFRPLFRKAHEEARGMGIYCQKYCGCVYSEVERYARNK